MKDLPADMPRHIPVHSAHDHHDEVVGLNSEELSQVDIANLNVPAVGIDIYEIFLIPRIVNYDPDCDDDELDSNHCENCDNLSCFRCHELGEVLLNSCRTHI